jgi:hypothetical protein
MGVRSGVLHIPKNVIFGRGKGLRFQAEGSAHISDWGSNSLSSE